MLHFIKNILLINISCRVYIIIVHKYLYQKKNFDKIQKYLIYIKSIKAKKIKILFIIEVNMLKLVYNSNYRLK